MSARLADVAQDALCTKVDTELFFPEKGSSPLAAKAICLRCPVRAACLSYALANDVDGVWGGTTWDQRRQLRRTRTAA